MIKCKICNKEFKNKAGLAGHKTISHGEAVGKRAEFKEIYHQLKRLEELHEEEKELLWKIYRAVQ